MSISYSIIYRIIENVWNFGDRIYNNPSRTFCKHCNNRVVDYKSFFFSRISYYKRLESFNAAREIDHKFNKDYIQSEGIIIIIIVKLV